MMELISQKILQCWKGATNGLINLILVHNAQLKLMSPLCLTNSLKIPLSAVAISGSLRVLKLFFHRIWIIRRELSANFCKVFDESEKAEWFICKLIVQNNSLSSVFYQIDIHFKSLQNKLGLKEFQSSNKVLVGGNWILLISKLL